MKATASNRKLLLASHQNRLAERLRKMNPNRSYAIIQEIISRDPKIGLSIANRVIRGQRHLESLFNEGLDQSNESTMRFWIDALGPRLGPRRVVELITRKAKSDADAAGKAMYWLPSLVKHDESAKQSLGQLQRSLKVPAHYESSRRNFVSWMNQNQNHIGPNALKSN